MVKATRTSILVGLFGLLVPALAQAQRRSSDIPAEHRPPAGMCRIWIEGVPAGQQPAATDCATAIRTRPSNGKVVFGAERPDPRRTQEAQIPKGWGPRPRQSEDSRRSEPQPRREEPRREEPRREEPKREEPRREERRREEPPRRERPKPDHQR